MKIRNLMMAMFALSMLTVVSCGDKEDENNNGGQQGGTTVNEGIYNPACKIVEVKENNSPVEHWTWTDGKLMKITPYYDGELSEADATSFGYNSSNMIVRTTGPENSQVDFTYNSSNQLAAVSAKQNGNEMIGMRAVRNSSGKIGKMEIDLSDEFVEMIIGSMMGGEDGPDYRAGAKAAKGLTDNVSAEANLTWNGDNISRSITNVTFGGNMSVSELSEMPFFEALLSAYPTVQAALAMLGNMQVPVEVAVCDTIDYTYETGKHNPRYGLFEGEMDFTSFSAAPVKTSVENGSVSFNVSLPVPGLPLPYVMKTADNETASYTYTFNTAGFPLTCTDSEGGTTEYIYAE